MMSAEQIIDKFGKKKFLEMAHNQPNGRTGAQKDRGIKGRIKFRYCEHGTCLIDNYEPQKPCGKCHDIEEVQTKSKDFRPYFNAGLGYYVESRSEEKRCAKMLGLVEAG